MKREETCSFRSDSLASSAVETRDEEMKEVGRSGL